MTTAAAAALTEGAFVLTERGRALAARERERSPIWLQSLRQNALESLGRLGFPAPGTEAYRYFDVKAALARLVEAPAPPAGTSGCAGPGAREAVKVVEKLGIAQRSLHQLVFVNGRLDGECSRVEGLPKGVRLEGISRVVERSPALLESRLGLMRAHQRHPFVALNTASFLDGAFLHVPDGVVVSQPLHVVHVADASAGPVALHPRVLLVLGENAQATVVETYVGTGAASVNPVTEAYLGPHALLDHYELQENDLSADHLRVLDAHAGPGSQLFSHLFSVGARLARNEIAVQLHGDGAATTLDGLYLARGTQLVDNHTTVDHARPHCGSQQYYKGVLDGNARGAFDGRVVVRPHAAKTDAHQRNRNLLLSGTATIDSKPSLEIFHNDVRCTHGSATGRLDPDQLFYLRSRGFGETQARALLTLAFASEITARVKVEPLREHLEARVLSWLSGNGDGGAR